jgi:hypothetical protein
MKAKKMLLLMLIVMAMAKVSSGWRALATA